MGLGDTTDARTYIARDNDGVDENDELMMILMLMLMMKIMVKNKLHL